MSTDSRFVWIKTQDGSPTLWNNELGEPYRSVKGAFHESLIVFVKPAIEFAKELAAKKKEIIVGEFGLGAGTNWVFFSALAQHFGIPFRYFAIERDVEAFEMAIEMWSRQSAFLSQKIKEHFGVECAIDCSTFKKPEVHPTLDAFLLSLKAQEINCDLWFHDPFGAGVNPEGYSEETIHKCSEVWAKPFIGLSYACNGSFQRALKSALLHTKVVELNSPPLKKEALQFSKS